MCENTLGGYKCVCEPGYRGNGTHCEGKQSSSDVPSSKKKRLLLDVTRARVLSDENECASGIHGCDPNARCGNIIGSYFCQCYQGFNGDGRSCFGGFHGSRDQQSSTLRFQRPRTCFEDCPPSQTSTSAPSTTATASTTAPTSREASAASAPPVTSWTRTDAAAQVRHNRCRCSAAPADLYTTSHFSFHINNFLLCK